MNFPWFRRVGLFYIPATTIGWLIYTCSLLIAVYLFIDINSKSHSVSDTLISFLFNLMLIAAVYSLIAFVTSRNTKE